ncbi:MAG: HD domain-containing protein [Deltaproteobacteria bacterium]|nr:HD domain-containing protein [Deltaproteobacteria bacterium]
MNHLPFIRKIIASGGEVYIVGGNVRDLFLKIQHKDFDLLVRKLDDGALSDILKKFGTVSQVGRSFGVIKFRPSDSPETEYDFSLPRVEKSTGTGHRDFEVDFNPQIPVEDDLARRDFTINAMALQVGDEKLVDPYGGARDLRDKVLRQVFPRSFPEDPLRLLRAVQFSARFNLEIEKETLSAMKEHANLIATVSPERVALEIGKLFMAKKPSEGFDLMRETGILPIIFPFVHEMIGIIQPMKKNEDVYTHTMKVLDASKGVPEMENGGDLNLMFAALLHDAGKPKTVGFDKDKNRVTFYGHQIVSRRIAAKWLEKYRISILGVDIPKILNIIEGHMFETKAFFSDKAIRRFVNKVGKEDIFDLIDLRIADKKGGRYPESMKGILNLRSRIREEIERKVPFSAKDLAVNGHDLIAMGYKPGPIMGKIQAFLVDRVLDEPELNTKETLTELVKEHFTA